MAVATAPYRRRMTDAALVIAPLALAAGMLAARALRDLHRLAAVAAGLLLALVAFDLLPDAVADGGEAGLPTVFVVAMIAIAAVGTVWLLRGSGATDCCRRGRTGAGALALHGLLEGAVLGAGLGLVPESGPLLIAGFAFHKAAEGAMLAGTLRMPGPALGVDRALPLVAATAPVIGALGGSLVELPPVLAAAAAAVLAGLLGAVAGLQLRQAAAGPSGRLLAGIGAAGMVLILQWAGA